jgi:bacterioferritin
MKMLQLACKMEVECARQYNKRAKECSGNDDAVSKQLFEELIAEEEKHLDRFSTELSNIHKFGDNYLALQSIERSKEQALKN